MAYQSGVQARHIRQVLWNDYTQPNDRAAVSSEYSLEEVQTSDDSTTTASLLSRDELNTQSTSSISSLIPDNSAIGEGLETFISCSFSICISCFILVEKCTCQLSRGGCTPLVTARKGLETHTQHIQQLEKQPPEPEFQRVEAKRTSSEQLETTRQLQSGRKERGRIALSEESASPEYHRLCKPGKPPTYPLISAPLCKTDTMFAEVSCIIASIKAMLNGRSIPYCSVTARNRYPKGSVPNDSDQTILIVGPEYHGWNVFLWDVIELTNLFLLGLEWRVEFLTPEGESFERMMGYQMDN